MAVRVLNGLDGEQVLYDSTTMVPFGIINETEFDLNDFLEYLDKDARRYTHDELVSKYYDFIRFMQSEYSDL